MLKSPFHCNYYNVIGDFFYEKVILFITNESFTIINKTKTNFMITLSRDIVRLIQTELNMPESQRDGILGSGTETVMRNFLQANKSKLDPLHAENILNGSRKRMAVAFGQIKALEKNIDTGKVDGFLGPQTNVALDSLVFLIKHKRPPVPFRDHTIPNSTNWPVEGSIEFHERFGKQGERNLVSIKPAYPHKLAWDLSEVARTIRCHKEVADSLSRVFSRVLEEYGQERISELGLDIFSGCYNKRKKRGGSSPSMHSWGIALDFFDSKNRLNWHQDRALFARPEYDKWWEIWEDEGWVSLGRVRDFDWMHVQAVRLKGM